MKIAVLEDVLASQLIIENAIEKVFGDVNVYFFEHSEALVQRCKTTPFDLILADLYVLDTAPEETVKNLMRLMQIDKTEIVVHSSTPDCARPLLDNYPGWVKILNKCDGPTGLMSILQDIDV